MSQDVWTAVDRYFGDLLFPPDEVLDAALTASESAGLPAIQVTPAQGKLLHLIARMIGARRVLELGTLGGYSTIWLARALPDGGSLVTLEADEKHAEVARANLARAGLTTVVDLRLGRALDTLPQIAAETRGAFDLVFIDADKARSDVYFLAALELSQPGGVIIVDNVVRDGAVVDPARTDADIMGVRRLMDLLAHEPRVDATAVQTVGSKGYDGFLLARVKQ